MSKLKTKRGAKKRIMNITPNGKVKTGQTGKRHGMIKRSGRQKLNQRGTVILPDMEAKRLKQFVPYGI